MADIPQKGDRSNYYLWFDAEFTSLDLDRAELLQVALMVTDAQLQRVQPPDQDINLFIRLEPDVEVSPWVQRELPKLLETCRSEWAVSVGEADQLIAQRLDALFGKPGSMIKYRPVLAGNSLHNDWCIARRLLPSLIDRVHYRLFDVSSWKMHWINNGPDREIDKNDEPWVRKNFPGHFAAEGALHDAYYDIHASISELNYYCSQGSAFTTFSGDQS